MAARAFNRVAGLGHPRALAALRTELDLLREENARLRMRELQPTVAVPALRLAGGGPADGPGVGGDATRTVSDAADDAWQRLTEALVVRDSLIDTCDQLVAVATRLRQRLEELTPWPAGVEAADSPAPSGGSATS